MPNAGSLTSFTATYVNDGYVRLQVNGNTGSPTTAPERLYFSRWNQTTNSWDGEYFVSSQHYDGNDPGSIAPTANRKYRWRVRGWRSDGTGGFGPYLYSDYVQTTPAAPSGASVVLTGPNAMAVSWTNNSTNPFYDFIVEVLYAKDADPGWTSAGTYPYGTTSAAFNDLLPGSTYIFGIRAIGTYGTWLYSGITTTNTLTAINYPASITGLTASRVSDTQATLSWTNNSSASAPYSTIQVDRWDSSSKAWTTITNVSGTTTSLTDAGIVAGRKYQYRVVPYNGLGSATSTSSGYIYTTPNAPNAVTTQYTGGTSLKIDWLNQYATYTEYTLRVQLYKNGVADGSVITLASGVTTTTQTVTAGNSYYAKVWAVSNTGSLASTQTQSNAVSAAAPPNAPTGLTSSAAHVDLTRPYTVSWVHAPTDGSAQTKYQIQHRVQGSGTWTLGSVVTSTESTAASPFTGYTNGQAIEWQVRTYGVHANPGPFSATKIQNTSSTPVVAITSPASILLNSTITVSWTYTGGNPQSEWAVDLYDDVSSEPVARATGLGTATTTTLGYAAVDGGSYRVDVRARDSAGLWSDTVSKTFSGAFTPPAPVTLTTTLDGPSGAALLTMAPTAPVAPGGLLRVNAALNARAEPTGHTGEYQARFSWTRTMATGNVAAMPSALQPHNVNTYAKFTCPADQTGVTARGVDLYANIDSAPATTGHAIAQPIPVNWTVAMSAYIRSSVACSMVVVGRFHDGAGNWLDSTSVSAAVAAPANGWVRVSIAITAPSGTGNVYAAFGIRNTGTATFPAGATLDVTGLVVETGGGSAINEFFDGASPRTETDYHEWVGTPYSSASRKRRVGSLAASAVTIERRFYDYETESFGEWETLIAEAPVDATIIDPTAPTHDDGEYRAIAHSIAPSIGRPNTTVKPAAIDNRWLYVSGGPQFDVVCKMWANIEISQTASRERALHYFAGRRNPVIYSGEKAERTYSVSGILEEEASDPNQWIRLARQAGPVLLRAPGRRMFGNLSEVSIDRIQNGLHKVSFSIQEVAT